MIKISKSCFSAEAIKRVLYILLPEQTVMVTEDNLNYVIASDKISEQPFLDKLLEVQIQIDLENKFYLIRNMLVAQALEPYQNVGDLLQRLKNEKL